MNLSGLLFSLFLASSLVANCDSFSILVKAATFVFVCCKDLKASSLCL